MWQRLVDQLEDSAHLPTVLQSLGCIAQNANPIFETREEEVIKFVVRNVLRRSIEQEQAMDSKPGWENPSDIVLLKVRERQSC
jgi:sister-chromatid-cohesion protein PDS5